MLALGAAVSLALNSWAACWWTWFPRSSICSSVLKVEEDLTYSCFTKHNVGVRRGRVHLGGLDDKQDLTQIEWLFPKTTNVLRFLNGDTVDTRNKLEAQLEDSLRGSFSKREWSSGATLRAFFSLRLGFPFSSPSSFLASSAPSSLSSSDTSSILGAKSSSNISM